MKKLITFCALTIALLVTVSNCMIAEKKENETLRKANGVYDLQEYDREGTDYYTTNYGLFGLNVAQAKGGVFWPRLTENQYIYASGFWFGAQKMNPDKSGRRKYVTISYNPNSGRSWFVPGRIDDGDLVDTSKEKLYRIYFSDDFDEYSGEGDSTYGPNWPLWKFDYYPSWLMMASNYVADPLMRKSDNYDVRPLYHKFTNFCTYKDTDLSRYDDGASERAKMGYPLKLQIDQRVFSNFHVHPFASESDNIILQYVITNKSSDTLFDCYFSSVIDADLALASNSQNGANNDRVSFYSGNEYQPDFAYAWTMTDQGELGKGFGYMGVAFLEVPLIANDKYLDTIYAGNHYTSQNSKGIYTFRNWSVNKVILSDDERYDYISSGVKDGDNGPGDKRMLLSTYPFHLRPGESTRIAVLIAFAKPKIRPEADGTMIDAENLVNNVSSIFKDYHDFAMDVRENPGSYCYISPNPASDYIQINVGAQRAVPDGVSVYDILGMKVNCGNATPPAPSQEGETVRLDVSHLSPGIYFVRMGNEVRKFVKI